MTADFVVIGGGIIGLTVGRELRNRYSDASIVLLEKEVELGQHASGRNSGVLHAGFYYTADSLKARFCRDGNRAMRRFCAEKGLRVRACGKLVVARGPEDLPRLDELKRRADLNGVSLEPISESEARAIEPRARTWEHALFSPTTATVNPSEVIAALRSELQESGVTLCIGVAYRARKSAAIVTDSGEISAGLVINAGGLYADRIARDFGFARDCRVLPFKGLYLLSSEPPDSFRTNIYPVPDLKNPFLGVHVTVTVVDGRAKIGPTATPCLWREQYGGLHGLRLEEIAEIVGTEMGLLVHAGFDFRGIALQEIRKYRRAALVEDAGRLAVGLDTGQFRTWGRPGIRAQHLDIRRRTLVMDFRIERDERSLHILNAVSPAFTCSIAFAGHIVDLIEGRASDLPAEG